MRNEPLESFKAALADRYAVERELGRGASAVVYLAKDLRHGRPVALKVLHSALGEVLGAERFLREIRTAARLQHPHILPLFDSGIAAGRLFYVMPYVADGSLDDRLQRQGPIPVEEARRIAAEVCAALGHAHAAGIVHRDIKPENILLTADGKALLADFGIACALESPAADEDGASGEPALTETGVAVGTPAYMSPEQAHGDEPIDGRTDIYALASVLYEVLAGSPPFTGPNARALLAQRLTEPPPSVRAVRPDVPPAMDAALRKAMSRLPAERFSTAAEFAEGLVLGVPGAGWRTPLRWIAGAAGAAALLAAVLAGRSWMVRPAAEHEGARMLAVLPFRNLGQPADQYFADGLTEEITSRLAGVSGLRVVSRGSADQYRNTTKTLKQIGEELGAGYILAGSVRWERPSGGPGRVRVTPQLIQVADDGHLWSEGYDAELTEVLSIQTNIAERVATALDVALGEPERAALAAGGTRSPEAYDFYLRGNDYLGRSFEREDLLSAVDLHERAARADPAFALALARAARAHAALFWFGHDVSDARLARARVAADSALRLAPDLPEARIALGYYHYWGHLDYERALEQFAAARRRQPSNTDVLSAIGYVERRRGRWNEALARLTEASRYDPRSNMLAKDLADTYFAVRLYPEAERFTDRAIALAPDWASPHVGKAELYRAWRGDADRARAVLGAALTRIDPAKLAAVMMASDHISGSIFTADSVFAPMVDALTLASFSDTVRFHLLKAEAHHFRNHTAAVRAYADSARSLLERSARARPDDPKILARLGLVYAYLGRAADAVASGSRAVELLPLTRDAHTAPYMATNLARIHLLLGQPEQAIDRLAPLLQVPCRLSAAELRIDRLWAPLRSHPRFRKLIQDSTTAG